MMLLTFWDVSLVIHPLNFLITSTRDREWCWLMVDRHQQRYNIVCIYYIRSRWKSDLLKWEQEKCCKNKASDWKGVELMKDVRLGFPIYFCFSFFSTHLPSNTGLFIWKKGRANRQQKQRNRNSFHPFFNCQINDSDNQQRSFS